MTQPMLSFPDGLFDTEETAVPPRVNTTAFDAGARVALDDTSWIEHVPDLVTGHQALMSSLQTVADWEQRKRWMFNRLVAEPRLTAEYRQLDNAPELLREIAAVLSQRYGVGYDRIWMNWYRDNNDGTSWHADRPANVANTAIVPVLSLGSARRFLIRPAGGGRSVVFTPAGGDLVVMGGRCQRDYQHGVPKRKNPTGARISLNFSSRSQS